MLLGLFCGQYIVATAGITLSALPGIAHVCQCAQCLQS